MGRWTRWLGQDAGGGGGGREEEEERCRQLDWKGGFSYHVLPEGSG